MMMKKTKNGSIRRLSFVILFNRNGNHIVTHNTIQFTIRIVSQYHDNRYIARQFSKDTSRYLYDCRDEEFNHCIVVSVSQNLTVTEMKQCTKSTPSLTLAALYKTHQMQLVHIHKCIIPVHLMF